MRGRSVRRGLRARLAKSAKRLRVASGSTQEQIAERAGLNPRHYQKIETGSVNVTLNTLEQLSQAFGVDVTELFGQP